MIKQRIMSVITTGAVFALGMTAAIAADHPAIGTWRLNLAKSIDESGAPPPKSQTFVFASSTKGISLSTKIVRADGKVVVGKGEPIKWDGMPHPETRDPDHDSITVKQVGVQTIEWAMTKNGTPVRSGTMAVSQDGKTMIVSGASTTARGKVYFNYVFDRK